jgi:hypothetical protein
MSNAQNIVVVGQCGAVEHDEHAGAFIETAFSPAEVAEAVALEKVRGGDRKVCGFLGVMVGDGGDNQ